MPEQQGQNINIKVSDEILKGVYANLMFASHSKEEFILDFISAFGPQGEQVAKVIVSPGHFKRIVAAVADNLKKYEAQFGPIKEEQGPATAEKSSTSKFGFN